ncbi:MAG: hypothetical protein AAF804_05500 [Bacteroidota bacterium]
MSRRLWLFLLCSSVFYLLQAQVPDSISIESQTENIDQNIEDLIIGTETDEQVDFTYLTDQLEAWATKPLDLNQAEREDLLLLPSMTDLLYAALRRHIAEFGALTSLYELQAVQGFDLAVIRQIQPYITVRDIAATDLSPGATHPTGPSFREVSEGLEFELIQRFVTITETQRGYTDPDTSFREILDQEGNAVGFDTLLSTRFAGSPWRSYTRLRARYGKNVSLALVGEKDPGEAFRWDPDNRLYGYDFLAGHFALANYGHLKSLVIGDYNLAVGQGLTLSRGLGFGKSAQSVAGVKMPSIGLRPYASVNENQLFRGAAATLAWGRVYVTGFYSRIRLDASVSDRDTLSNEALLASGLQLSGLHRTPSELANRRSVLETSYGARVEYRGPTLTLGSTHYVQRFATPLFRPFNAYNQFDFRGDLNYLNALDFDWVYQNFNFFGEVARSRSGGWGAIGGLMSSLAPTVDFSLVARHFDRDFHSNKAYVFAERPTAAQNETGVYLGLKIAPNPKWTLNAYLDQYRFPWNRFQADFPSTGWEFLGQLQYKPKRGTLIYTRYRSDNREVNADEIREGQQVNFLVPTRRQQWRLHFETRLTRDVLYRTRMEFSWYRQESQRERGFLLYQDLAWKIGYQWKLTARYAIFDVSDFDARIYAYENDVLGFFTIPPYFNRGSRYYLIVNFKATRRLQFWFRLAQTRLREIAELDRPPFLSEIPDGESWLRYSQGSGLNEINAPNRTELKFQVMWKF